VVTANFSGDTNNNNPTPNPTACGDTNETVNIVPPPPSAQITPTNTTCQQFSSGTAGTITSFNYSGDSTGTISNANPGVFFYYDKVSMPAGVNTVTVTESITSTNTFPSGEAKYLLPVLNGSTNQVQLYDSGCNTISGATITVGPVNPANDTYPVTITTPSTLPAGTYIFSIKYTPKGVVGLGVPSPTTINYSFSGLLNGAAINGSTQGISGVKM
jgi:hypothetical protein